MAGANSVIIRLLGRQDYQTCWHAMQEFTKQRDETTPDEIWLLEHNPVFTQGQNGKPEHLLNPGQIPVIHVDRGGQVTYHGPGQLVAYILVDLKRKKFNIREIVSILENSVIQLLADFQITATAKRTAPGVYVNDKKICSIGLRIRRGCSYHGLALNVAMDLEPFSRINPCGFQSLEMTQLHDFFSKIEIKSAETKLVDYLIANLRYTDTLIAKA
jgi:lipoyl(octanoyl) transferase